MNFFKRLDCWFVFRLYSMTIPQRERDRTNNDRTAPLRTPTHIGCAFSIDREFFNETDRMTRIWTYGEVKRKWPSEYRSLFEYDQLLFA